MSGNKVEITISGDVGVGKSVIVSEIVALMKDKYQIDVEIDAGCGVEDLPPPEWLVEAMQQTEWVVAEKVKTEPPKTKVKTFISAPHRVIEKDVTLTQRELDNLCPPSNMVVLRPGVTMDLYHISDFRGLVARGVLNITDTFHSSVSLRSVAVQVGDENNCYCFLLPTGVDSVIFNRDVMPWPVFIDSQISILVDDTRSRHYDVALRVVGGFDPRNGKLSVDFEVCDVKPRKTLRDSSDWVPDVKIIGYTLNVGFDHEVTTRSHSSLPPEIVDLHKRHPSVGDEWRAIDDDAFIAVVADINGDQITIYTDVEKYRVRSVSLVRFQEMLTNARLLIQAI